MHYQNNTRPAVNADAAFWADFGLDVYPMDKFDQLVGAERRSHPATPAEALKRFAQHRDSRVGTILPPRVIAFQADGEPAGAALSQHLDALGTPPRLWAKTRSDTYSAFYLLPAGADPLQFREGLPKRVVLLGEGDEIELPSGSYRKPLQYDAVHVGTLSTIALPAGTDTALAEETPEGVDPVVTGNPLEKHSLRGHADEVEARAKETTPLLGNVALAGQATIIYAPPGSGKTLLTLWMAMEAIKAARVLGGNVYYINADDNSLGLATKLRMLDDLGAHTLVPSYQGFAAGDLVRIMQAMADRDQCRGVVVIVDTLKKAVDLMDKPASAAFGQAMRAFVVHGGTFIGLGHTRKNPSPTGKLVHGGTTDLLEDADAACMLTPLPVRTPAGEKVAQFQFIKRRGDNQDEAYAYIDAGAASYAELIASVRKVDPENLDRFVAEAEAVSDEPVIAAVAASIGDGIVQKMLLADEVAKRARVSTRTAIQVLERYQGDDPAEHRWTYTVQARGAKVYQLHGG